MPTITSVFADYMRLSGTDRQAFRNSKSDGIKTNGICPGGVNSLLQPNKKSHTTKDMRLLFIDMYYYAYAAAR